MAHYDKIPDLLNNLVLTPAIATACRAVGISRETFYSWLIASRQGKAELAAIEWHGVVAPFHEHYQNGLKLSVLNIEAIARDRALNGVMVEARYKGAKVFLQDEKIVKYFGDGEFNADDCELQFGQRDLWLRNSETGERVAVEDKIEPSPQLVALILQSHISKYAKHATLDVTHGGILKIDDKPGPKQIEQSAPAELVQLEEADDNPEEPHAGFLAIPAPLDNPADIDAMAKAGAFKSQDVTFTKEDGSQVTVPGAPPAPISELDKLADKPGDRDDIRKLKAEAREMLARAGTTPSQPSAPVFIGKPEDEPPERKKPEPRADQASLGRGQVLPGGMKTA